MGTHWDFLYFRLPMLLYYAVEVVEALIAPSCMPASRRRIADTTSTTARRSVTCLWMDSLNVDDFSLEPDPIELPGLSELRRCGCIGQGQGMLSFYHELKITCRICGTVHDASEETEETAG